MSKAVIAGTRVFSLSAWVPHSHSGKVSCNPCPRSPYLHGYPTPLMWYACLRTLSALLLFILQYPRSSVRVVIVFSLITPYDY